MTFPSFFRRSSTTVIQSSGERTPLCGPPLLTFRQDCSITENFEHEMLKVQFNTKPINAFGKTLLNASSISRKVSLPTPCSLWCPRARRQECTRLCPLKYLCNKHDVPLRYNLIAIDNTSTFCSCRYHRTPFNKN